MGGVVSGLGPLPSLRWFGGPRRPPPASPRPGPWCPPEQVVSGRLQTDQEVGEGGTV